MTHPLNGLTTLALATAIADVKPRPVETDATLPGCPTCSAPAIAGYALRTWNDLAHDCNCVVECEQAYLSGLRRIWQRQHALPHYLGTLPERYRAYTLGVLTETEHNRAVLRTARAGLAGNLYLYGPAGTGKTHLAVAAARQLAAAGRTMRFWGMASLFKALRDSFAHDGAPRPELHHWDVLVLDDIDKLKPTQYVYETFYELIEARWANGKVTVFTAQQDPDAAARALTPEGNERAADPLASRMSSGILARIEGDDVRFQQDGGAP